MADKKKRRYASISLATKEGDSWNYDAFGVILGDPEYPGSGSILLEVDTDQTKTIQTAAGEKEVPIRARLVAGKFLVEEGPETGKEILVDVSESFINTTFWHEMERSPKAKG